LVTVDVDPEVSFLAFPSRFPPGTLLISTISPPSAEFAAKYEPATGRKAGPHAWPGYLAMKAALEVLDRTAFPRLGRPRAIDRRNSTDASVHALYVVKEESSSSSGT